MQQDLIHKQLDYTMSQTMNCVVSYRGQKMSQLETLYKYKIEILHILHEMNILHEMKIELKIDFY